MATPASSAVLYARLLARARLRHVQLICAVAELGGIKRAAAAVGMSQPAATQALAEIERLIDSPLFERHARGIRLTAQGQVMVPVLRQMLQALRASTENLWALQQGLGVVRIGAIPAAASALVAPLIVRHARRHPALRFEVHEDQGEHLLHELTTGALDLLIGRRPAALAAHLQFLPLQDDSVQLLAGLAHPLARRRRLTLDELVNYPWMIAPTGLQVRDVFDHLFANRPGPPIHPVSTTALPILVEILADQRTVALLPASIGQSLCRWGLTRVLPVELGAHIDGLGVVLDPALLANPAVQALVTALQRFANARGVKVPPSAATSAET